MYGNSYSQEQQPIFYLRGYPMYAAHTIVAGYVASLLVTFVFLTARLTAPLEVLTFTPSAVLHGQVWRLLTYGLVNPPSLRFAVDLLWIFWAGREVERTLGRTSFLWLYAGIYLMGPAVSLVFSPWLDGALAGETGAFGLFIAFATFFPGALIVFTLTAQVCAVILVSILEMIAISRHDWSEVGILTGIAGLAHLWVRHAQGRFELPRLRIPRPARRAARPARPVAREPALGAASMAEVDRLLDKIAASGFNSLTAGEKARLDSARSEIRRRSNRE